MRVIKAALSGRFPIVEGEVVEVEGATCKVKPDALPPLYDVRLQAIETASSGVLVVPKKGSRVVLCFLSESDSDAIVVSTSEIDKIDISFDSGKVSIDRSGISLEGKLEVSVGSSSISLDERGFALEAGGQDFKGVILDLINVIMSLKPVSPVGPCTPDPQAIATLAQTIVNLNTVLK